MPIARQNLIFFSLRGIDKFDANAAGLRHEIPQTPLLRLKRMCEVCVQEQCMFTLKIKGRGTEKTQGQGTAVSLAAIIAGGGQGLWSLEQ